MHEILGYVKPIMQNKYIIEIFSKIDRLGLISFLLQNGFIIRGLGGDKLVFKLTVNKNQNMSLPNLKW